MGAVTLRLLTPFPLTQSRPADVPWVVDAVGGGFGM
jgi:hypothetical protein